MEREENHEQEPPLSYMASRFSVERQEVSHNIYLALQEIVKTKPVELSVYRFMIPSEISMESPWIVAVLGEIPREGEIYLRLKNLLMIGEPTFLPESVVQHLLQRREEERQKEGFTGYSEKHYKYTLKKKNKQSPKQRRDPRHQGRRH